MVIIIMIRLVMIHIIITIIIQASTNVMGLGMGLAPRKQLLRRTRLLVPSPYFCRIFGYAPFGHDQETTLPSWFDAQSSPRLVFGAISQPNVVVSLVGRS